ncbi:hypothetical protein ID0475_14830 [Helicobacter pylori]
MLDVENEQKISAQRTKFSLKKYSSQAGTESSNNELTYWEFDILPIAKARGF